MKEETRFILKPSVIEGVGVFTKSHLPKGLVLEILEGSDDKHTRFVSVEEAKKDVGLFEMCERYGVLTKNGYWCPADFCHIHIGWYINHSTNPNVGTIDRIVYKTLKEILPGEELVMDYKTLDEDIDNSIL